MTMTRGVETDYREAFENFSRKAERVQFLAREGNAGEGNNNEKAFETALLDLERAHLAYNQARDAFLRSLLPESAQIPAFDNQAHASDVPTLAELLWESAGRPDGTAEEDWRRAEAIVKRAVATTACS
jgi:hypothetical protein